MTTLRPVPLPSMAVRLGLSPALILRDPFTKHNTPIKSAPVELKDPRFELDEHHFLGASAPVEGAVHSIITGLVLGGAGLLPHAAR